MKKSPTFIAMGGLAALGAVALASVGVFLCFEWKAHPPRSVARAALITEPALPQNKADLQAFVEANKKNRSEKVQDRVGAARLRLAYLSAAHRDWETARATLLTAAKEYKGTNAMSGDFGGVPDQARYQAAVCLIAEGKKPEGRKELVSFMQDEPLSPLATAAYRRIQRLDGKEDARLDALLQKDISLQEKHVHFETSVCGPKCIERLVQTHSVKFQGPLLDYKQLAKLCGTNDRGTTVEQMRECFSTLGVSTFACLLNARDLSRAPLPAVLLQAGHYVVMESRNGSTAQIYDPAFAKVRDWPLPQGDRFNIPVIIFSRPDFVAQTAS